MSAPIYVSIDELCKIKNLKRWRVYDLTRQGKMPVKHLAGKPVIPYLIDLGEFEKLECTATTAPPQEEPCSVTIKEKRIRSSHRKEPAWLE